MNSRVVALLALAATAVCTGPRRGRESTSFEQTFEVVDYDGEDAPEAHRAFLAALEP